MEAKAPCDVVALSAATDEAPPVRTSWIAVAALALAAAAPALAAATPMAAMHTQISTTLEVATQQPIAPEQRERMRETAGPSIWDNMTSVQTRRAYGRAAEKAIAEADTFTEQVARIERESAVLDAMARRGPGTHHTWQGKVTVEQQGSRTIASSGNATLTRQRSSRTVTVKAEDFEATLTETPSQLSVTENGVTRTLYRAAARGGQPGDFEVSSRMGRGTTRLLVHGASIEQTTRETIADVAGNLEFERSEKFEIPEMQAAVFPGVALRQRTRTQTRDTLTNQANERVREVEVRTDSSSLERIQEGGAKREMVEPRAIVLAASGG
ncbi:MAG: hypothetical protein FJX76_24075 [Armatimonadetes bacterium]|nr:hypothetical protein [Armatimonadota bacterium]